MALDEEGEDHRDVLERLRQAFTGLVPHNQALELELCDFSREGAAVMRLPYRPELVGNPETGVLHGGAITALLDATAGAAVFVALWSATPIATLDLRIDHLRPATPGRDVLARCTCYKLTRNVAFARGAAYHDQESDPIACAAGTFMLSTRGSFARMGLVERR